MSRAQLTSTVEQNSAGAAAPIVGYKNFVANSSFDIWQRGTSISVAASTNTYTADRWYLATSANNAFTVSRIATGDTTNLPNIQYAVRVQRNSGQTGTGGVSFTQSFETANSIPFAGKTVTYSFYARAGSNWSWTSGGNPKLTASVFSGTGTDQNVASGYTGSSNNGNTDVTISTTWARYSITATIPANATEIAANFGIYPSGTAGTNDYVDITGVQLEVGSVATPFAKAAGTLQGELALCQRYYQQFNNPSYAFADFGFNGGVGISSTVIVAQKTLAVPMRAVPIVASFSNVSWVAYWGLGVTNITNVTAYNASSTQVASLQFTTTGVSAGTAYPIILQNNSTSAFIGISAEL
jgi:hypothetical protein